MRTIRIFEDRVHVKLYTGEMPECVQLCTVGEASAVGVCTHLTDKDKIIPGTGHMIPAEDSKTINSQPFAFMTKIDNLVDATP
jgi:hypothetical protein